MAQIAAQAFGISLDKVHVGSTVRTSRCVVSRSSDRRRTLTGSVLCATQDSDKVPNNPPTAASCTYTISLFVSGPPKPGGCCTDGADLNGMAVLNACQQIQERLQPLIDRYPEFSGPANFASLCNAAYYERINLMATGFYASPHGG